MLNLLSLFFYGIYMVFSAGAEKCWSWKQAIAGCFVSIEAILLFKIFIGEIR